MIKFRQKEFINYIPSVVHAGKKTAVKVVSTLGSAGRNIKSRNVKGAVKEVATLPKQIGAVPAAAGVVGAVSLVPGGATAAAVATKGAQSVLSRVKRGARQVKNKDVVARYKRMYNKKPTLLPSF